MAVSLVAMPALAAAHVGSPDVIFEGAAGAYPVRVTIREPGDWMTFEQPFAPPSDAITGKLCFRFVESTGEVLVDEVSVGE